ncbi:hypothetical protein ACP70R_040699 [Stipagrostis hirtigluma subsp. patula]
MEPSPEHPRRLLNASAPPFTPRLTASTEHPASSTAASTGLPATTGHQLGLGSALPAVDQALSAAPRRAPVSSTSTCVFTGGFGATPGHLLSFPNRTQTRKSLYQPPGSSAPCRYRGERIINLARLADMEQRYCSEEWTLRHSAFNFVRYNSGESKAGGWSIHCVSSPFGKDREVSDGEDHAMLQLHDLVERVLAKPSAEAHIQKQLQHGAPQEGPERDGVVAAACTEVADEGVASPSPRRREAANAGRLQRLAGEIASHEAPVGPVARGPNVAAAREQEDRTFGRRAVGDGGAFLNEHAVRQAAVVDEDERAAEAEGDDGAVARVQHAGHAAGHQLGYAPRPFEQAQFYANPYRAEGSYSTTATGSSISGGLEAGAASGHGIGLPLLNLAVEHAGDAAGHQLRHAVPHFEQVEYFYANPFRSAVSSSATTRGTHFSGVLRAAPGNQMAHALAPINHEFYADPDRVPASSSSTAIGSFISGGHGAAPGNPVGVMSRPTTFNRSPFAAGSYYSTPGSSSSVGAATDPAVIDDAGGDFFERAARYFSHSISTSVSAGHSASASSASHAPSSTFGSVDVDRPAATDPAVIDHTGGDFFERAARYFSHSISTSVSAGHSASSASHAPSSAFGSVDVDPADPVRADPALLARGLEAGMRVGVPKTVLCVHYMKKGTCSYGTRCSFAHGEEELQLLKPSVLAQAGKYKTRPCRNWTGGSCIFGSNCLFAHGANELKYALQGTCPSNRAGKPCPYGGDCPHLHY